MCFFKRRTLCWRCQRAWHRLPSSRAFSLDRVVLVTGQPRRTAMDKAPCLALALPFVDRRYCLLFSNPSLARPRLQMSPTGEHVSDVSDVLTVGQVVDVRIREVRCGSVDIVPCGQTPPSVQVEGSPLVAGVLHPSVDLSAQWQPEDAFNTPMKGSFIHASVPPSVSSPENESALAVSNPYLSFSPR